MVIGVGLDVIEIERVKKLLLAKGARAIGRLFTDVERSYCEARQVPERHYAARLAAKEAAFKALSGTDSARTIGWREIEVTLDGHGRPSLVLRDRALARATELGSTRTWVSLTHGDSVAAAVVVLEAF